MSEDNFMSDDFVDKKVAEIMTGLNECQRMAVLNNLGTIYYNNNNCVEAEKYYLKAYEFDNNHGTLLLNLGLLYIKMNDYDQARNYFMMIKDSLDKYTFKHHELIKYYFCDNESDSKEVMVFKNKCNIMEKYEKCIICYEECMCIPLECSHYTCRECYIRTIVSGKCGYCRMEF